MSAAIPSRAAACALVFAAVLAAAAADPARDARALIGVERQVSFSVTRQAEPAAIVMLAEYETAYPYPLETVVARIWDFARWPEIFSRVKASELLSDDGRTALTEQKTVIEVLGIKYVSVARFRNTVERPAPGRATCSFVSVGSDGSLISSEGSWRLRDASDERGNLTYLSYGVDNRVPTTLPGQEFMMRNFGGGDIARTVRELGKALDRAAAANANKP